MAITSKSPTNTDEVPQRNYGVIAAAATDLATAIALVNELRLIAISNGNARAS